MESLVRVFVVNMLRKLFKILLIIFLPLSLILVYHSDINAQSGCCSWHGGVCGCSPSGRKTCCDGTLSPSCTCGYVTHTPTYAPQIPKAPSINATFTYTPNNDGETFNVKMTWDKIENTGFSIALQNAAGGDPGPLTDTMNNYWTFKKVYTGTYYANMKVGINGYWSNVTYWKVVVPKWYKPIQTVKNNQNKKSYIPPSTMNTKSSNIVDENPIIETGAVIGGLTLLSALVLKIRKNLNS